MKRNKIILFFAIMTVLSIQALWAANDGINTFNVNITCAIPVLIPVSSTLDLGPITAGITKTFTSNHISELYYSGDGNVVKHIKVKAFNSHFDEGIGTIIDFVADWKIVDDIPANGTFQPFTVGTAIDTDPAGTSCKAESRIFFRIVSATATASSAATTNKILIPFEIEVLEN